MACLFIGRLLFLELDKISACFPYTYLAINGKQPPPFPHRDYRFNEFPNAAAHALYSICLELMALPVSGNVVGSALLDVVLCR